MPKLMGLVTDEMDVSCLTAKKKRQWGVQQPKQRGAFSREFSGLEVSSSKLAAGPWRKER